jgi:hypothetical protein
MNTCNYKPYNWFGQMAKSTNCKKTPRGMYNHNGKCILFATVGIFHALISYRIVWLHVWVHKILGNIYIYMN